MAIQKTTRKPKRMTISQQVRQAIEASDVSRYRIWKDTGIDQGTLSRFMAGDGGLSLEGLDAIGELLGLEIVIRKPRGKTPGPSKGR
ncbi:MAG: hypothetical protein K8T91_08535 [Planctomycetes bacterium]|nr:hypothetical protein [Planctomycetota bacterium]